MKSGNSGCMPSFGGSAASAANGVSRRQTAPSQIFPIVNFIEVTPARSIIPLRLVVALLRRDTESAEARRKTQLCEVGLLLAATDDGSARQQRVRPTSSNPMRNSHRAGSAVRRFRLRPEGGQVRSNPTPLRWVRRTSDG